MVARVWAKAGLQPHRAPEHLRSDNGAEFIAYAIVDWLAEQKIKTIYITPGSPWETATLKASTTSCVTSA